MNPLRLALDVASLQLPPAKALAAAAELGVSAVELEARGDLAPGQLSQTGLRQVRKLLDDYRLRVAALRFRTRRGYDTTAELDVRVEATKKAMQMAYALGAQVVLNHIGRVPADPQSDPWRLLVEVLGDLGRYGHHAGAWLAAETGSQCGPDLAKLLAALPEGTLGIDLDPGALLLGGFSPLEAVEALGPAILYVHATDASPERAVGAGRCAVLGEGIADWPALLSALDQQSYRGYFALRAPGSGSPVREASQGIDYLRRL